MPRIAARDIQDVRPVWSCYSPPSLVKCLSHAPPVIGPGGEVKWPGRSARSEAHVGRDAARPESGLFVMLARPGRYVGGRVVDYGIEPESRRPINPCRNALRTARGCRASPGHG